MLNALSSSNTPLITSRWHPTRPTDPEDRAGIDHVVLAFAMANATASFQPKVPISTIRSEFPNAKVMIAVGGWGDDIGFTQASKTDALIKQFAADVATMLTNTGADGVGEFMCATVCLITITDCHETLIGSILEVMEATTSK
jgi:chitinase